MNRFIAIHKHGDGLALYVLRKRIHHGLSGLVIAAIGIALVVDDWADRPWLKDN